MESSNYTISIPTVWLPETITRAEATITTSNTTNDTWTIIDDSGIIIKDVKLKLRMKKDSEMYKPVKVIFNPPYTICYFADGTKTIAKCMEEDWFIEEIGVMACITKKVLGSRGSFRRLVKDAHRQNKE